MDPVCPDEPQLPRLALPPPAAVILTTPLIEKLDAPPPMLALNEAVYSFEESKLKTFSST